MTSFLETWQTRNGFAKGRFFYLAEKKKHLATSNNPNRGSYVKHCSETRRSMTRTEKSYIKLFMSIFTRENSSHPAQDFFAGTLPSLLLDI